MIVQMKNALTGIRPGIDGDAKAALGDAVLASQLRGYLKDLADDRMVFGLNIEDSRDVLEDDHRVILEYHVRLDLLSDDAAKQAVGHDVLHAVLHSSAPGRRA